MALKIAFFILIPFVLLDCMKQYAVNPYLAICDHHLQKCCIAENLPSIGSGSAFLETLEGLCCMCSWGSVCHQRCVSGKLLQSSWANFFIPSVCMIFLHVYVMCSPTPFQERVCGVGSSMARSILSTPACQSPSPPLSSPAPCTCGSTAQGQLVSKQP